MTAQIDASGQRHSIDEILTAARSRLGRIHPERLASEQVGGALVIDIRPVEQRSCNGPLPGAIVIDRNTLEWRLDPACEHHITEITSYEQRIIIVCNEGYSSSLAAALLQELGLHQATDMIGGFQAWLLQTTDRPDHTD
jgi:rhodanese-related sulfurtransferase